MRTVCDSVCVPWSDTLMRQILPGPPESHQKPNMFYVLKNLIKKPFFLLPQVWRLRHADLTLQNTSSLQYDKNLYEHMITLHM